MDAKYEWRDKTGLAHPSLVCIDLGDKVTYNEPDAYPVLKVKKIDSFLDFFKGGILQKNRVPRIKDYRIEWYDTKMNHNYYAVFLAYTHTCLTGDIK